MNKLFLLTLFSLGPITAGFTQFYSFVEEGAGMKAEQWSRVMQQIEMTRKQIVETKKITDQAKSLVSLQEQTLKQLQSSKWNALEGTLKKQISLANNFVDLINNLQKFQEKESFLDGLPEDLNSLKERQKYIKENDDYQRDLKTSTAKLAENTQLIENTFASLLTEAKSDSNKSLVAQMQINNEAAILQSTQLMNIQNTLTAMQISEKMEKEKQKEQDRIDEIANKNYFDAKLVKSDGKYSKKQIENNIFGRERLKTGLIFW